MGRGPEFLAFVKSAAALQLKCVLNCTCQFVRKVLGLFRTNNQGQFMEKVEMLGWDDVEDCPARLCCGVTRIEAGESLTKTQLVKAKYSFKQMQQKCCAWE